MNEINVIPARLQARFWHRIPNWDAQAVHTKLKIALVFLMTYSAQAMMQYSLYSIPGSTRMKGILPYALPADGSEKIEPRIRLTIAAFPSETCSII